MKLRRMAEADRQRYVEMATAFYHSSAVLEPVPAAHFQRTFDELIRSDVYADGFLLEADDGACLGYALTAKTFTQEAGGPVVWLEELYVLPACQGQGVGSQALRLLEAQYPHARRLRLEIEPENEGAKRLYRRVGYRELPYLQMMKQKN